MHLCAVTTPENMKLRDNSEPLHSSTLDISDHFRSPVLPVSVPGYQALPGCALTRAAIHYVPTVTATRRKPGHGGKGRGIAAV